MNSLERVVVGSSGVVACDIDDGVALLDAARNIYFNLNPSGAVVWRAMSTPSSVGDICKAVADNFDVTVETCTPDVVRMIDRLIEMKLAAEATSGSE